MKQPAKAFVPATEVKVGQEIATVKSGELIAASPVVEIPKPRLAALAVRAAKWLAAVIVVLATGWYFGQNYILGPVVSVVPIIHQDVIQTIVASGQIQAPFQVKIGSQVSGIVKTVLIEAGQVVKAGDTLIQLDDSDAHEAVKLAQGVTAQWQAKLQQLTVTTLPAAKEAQLQAQANLDLAQAAFDRADRLLRQGVGTRADFDNSQKALLVAQSQARAVELQITSASPSGTDYMVAEAQLEQAQASQHSAETKLGYYQILAPFGGTLLNRSVDPGNTVMPGSTLMVLSPAGDTEVVVQIDEVNLGLLKLGQKAIVSSDAYPKLRFDGVLSYISPSVDPQSGSVEAKLSIASPPEYLRQDMTASVEIEVARRNDALVVEAANVHELSGGKPWVYLVENGKAHRQPVGVGTIGDDAVEIISGLQPGQVVVKGQGLGLVDGQRVRIANNG